MWYDAHSHFQDPAFAMRSAELIRCLHENGIQQCVVNGTQAADWQAVADICQTYPQQFIPAYGLHPWYLDQALPIHLEELRQRLKLQPHASLGECGIDSWIRSPSLDQQLPWFLAQLELAIELKRFVSIHCLKAWPILRQHREILSLLPKGFLLHAFGGDASIAKEWVEVGAYFSFNLHYLKTSKAHVRQAFQSIPAERILIETDAPSMLAPKEVSPEVWYDSQGKAHNHPLNLILTYFSLAKLRSCCVLNLQAQVRQNFSRCFDV